MAIDSAGKNTQKFYKSFCLSDAYILRKIALKESVVAKN